MNYWKHSLLFKKKFGGNAEDYLHIHKFLDMSKLFYFSNKHRILLHHTYGIDLCVQKMDGSGDIYIDNDVVKAKYSSTMRALIDYDEEADQEIYDEGEHNSTDKVLFAI